MKVKTRPGLPFCGGVGIMIKVKIFGFLCSSKSYLVAQYVVWQSIQN